MRWTIGDDVTVEVAGDARRFEWQVQLVDLGAVAVLPCASAGGLHVRGMVADYFVALPQAGVAQVSASGREVAIAPGQGAVGSPGLPLSWRAADPMRTTALRLRTETVTAAVEALTGATLDRPVVFEVALRTAPEIGRLCRFFVEEIASGNGLLAHPTVAAGMGDTIVRALLVGHPHDHAHLFAKTALPASLAVVRRVEEYLDAHAGEPVGMTDLAALTGSSVLAIEAAFQAHRGTTPATFLRGRRLERAGQRRLDPERASSAPPEPGGPAARLSMLTKRERAVCARAAGGMINKQIGHELGIAESTVKVHRARAMAKLGLASVVDLSRLLDRIGEWGG